MQWAALLQLIVASLLGGAVGYQRERSGKAAGVRTYAFVALGACLFTVLSYSGFVPYAGTIYDPSRVAAQVVVGIGFLGAGLIFVHRGHVEGLTTAAGLWVAAAIGMAIGVSQYFLAIVTTLLAVIYLAFGKKLHRNGS